MIFTETKLKGAFVIDVERREDERGFFGRAWCKKEFEAQGLNSDAVQANISFNKKKGTLRGMHYQSAPFSENKIVQCTSGSLYDVIIDIRTDSPSFKQWVGVELTAESFRIIYVPKGFAHGFITLEDNTAVHYWVTQYHTPASEAGIRFDDPMFNIEWPLAPVLVSEKDRVHAPFVDRIYKKMSLQ